MDGSKYLRRRRAQPMQLLHNETFDRGARESGSLQQEFDHSPRRLSDEDDFIHSCSHHFNRPDLSDVTLKVGSHSFYAHRFMLAKGSEVFKMMLFDKRFEGSEKSQDETNNNVLELIEDSHCEEVFDKFLEFLYTAKIEVDCESAVGVLCLADKYNMDALKRLVVDYMVEMSKSPQVSTALSWYSWAKRLNLPSLLEQCKRTIAWNWQDIVCSEEFIDMDIDFLEDLLHSSELVIENEYCIFEAVSSWLTADKRVESLEQNASRLLRLIRFPHMMITHALNIESSELASNSACRDLLIELLGKAYRFRAICSSQPALSADFGNDRFYVPREYTSLIVDTVKVQNTLRFGIQVDVKMYVGPAPSESREGDWKITYRKNNDIWSIQITPHDNALVNGDVNVMACAIVYNEFDKVIDVLRQQPGLVNRSQPIGFQIELQESSAHSMAVLLKPLP